MDAQYVSKLIDYLAHLYGEKFAKPTGAMVDLWASELKGVDRKAMYDAVKTWVRQHRPDYPPTLQGLLDTLETIKQAEEEEADILRQAQHRNEQPYTYLDAMDQAANREGSAWAHCHVQMVLRGLGSDRNLEETALQCEAYAAQYPEDAHDWHTEAAWWRSGAHGRPSFSGARSPVATGMMYAAAYEREPGEDDEPF